MKRKKMWIVLIALLLIVFLGAGGYQAYRFPDTFRSLSDKSADEKEVGRLVEQMREKKDKILVAYWDHCPMGTFYARQGRGDALLYQK